MCIRDSSCTVFIILAISLIQIYQNPPVIQEDLSENIGHTDYGCNRMVYIQMSSKLCINILDDYKCRKRELEIEVI